jgi:hypothetical protein
MTPLNVALEIKRLLQERVLTQAEIAKRFGISRNTVMSINKDRYNFKAAYKRWSPKEPDTPISKWARGICPICGHKGYLPCVACEARKSDNKSLLHARSIRDMQGGKEDCSINLVNGELEAYDKLLEKKKSQETVEHASMPSYETRHRNSVGSPEFVAKECCYD